MRKILFPLFLSVFLLQVTVAGAEQEELAEANYDLPYAAQTLYHQEVLENPRLYQDSLVYQDAELTVVSRLQEADKSFQIKSLQLNQNHLLVFELADGGFMEASQLLMFDDLVKSEEKINQEMIVGDQTQFWEQPLVFGTKVAKVKQKGYEKVIATKKAQTYSGLFYYIDKKGWVAASDTYPVEEAMSLVQEVLSSKYSSSKFSVYVRDLTNQSSAQINANKIMYAASVAKLAPLYMVQKQLDDEQLSLTDKFKYVKDVNEFEGAYETAGAGNMSKVADNKDYSVKDLLTAIGKRSDNAASNILSYYVMDKNSPKIHEELNYILGTFVNLNTREFSAKTAALMMAAIYEQGGEVIDFLTDTEFADSRIPKAIDAKVAHKTGDAYDFRHDVAIVYADRPFVLSIFTDGADHEDITKIAKDVYSILK